VITRIPYSLQLSASTEITLAAAAFWLQLYQQHLRLNFSSSSKLCVDAAVALSTPACASALAL
jgi:ACR3 family arsenite efflux pump ArsB